MAKDTARDAGSDLPFSVDFKANPNTKWATDEELAEARREAGLLPLNRNKN